jgi:Meckelin (Transmembrane protein 67)
LDYEIKEKALLEKLLDVELADTTEKAILYADDGSSFDRVLFYGMEFTLFSFDLALFCCTEMLFGDYLLAAVVTALVAKVYYYIECCLCEVRYSGNLHFAGADRAAPDRRQEQRRQKDACG